MKRIQPVHTHWELAPLKWHCFIAYFALPFGTLYNTVQTILNYQAALSPSGFSGALRESGLLWVLHLDFLASLCLIVITIAAVFNLLNRRWSGVVLLFSSYVAGIVCSLFYIIIGILHPGWFRSLIATGTGKIIVYSVYLALIWVYYQKRRLLFSPPPATEPKSEDVPPRQEGPGGFYTQAPQVAIVEPAVATPDEPAPQAASIAQETVPPPKEHKVYGPLDPPERKAGKRVPIWAAGLLGVGCLLLVVVCGVLGWQYRTVAQALDQEKQQTDALEEHVQLLELGIRNRDTRVSELKEEQTHYYLESIKEGAENQFWESNAVIIVLYEDGPGKLYHTYDCPFADEDISKGNFYIIDLYGLDPNVNLPCPECDPPELP